MTNVPEELKKGSLIRAVDDDPAIREALQFMLEAEGWRIRTYAGGQEFLTEDAPSVPGCAIIDVRMPGMSGLELQREMNVRGYRLPVIFLTGHGDIDMAVSAMREGAVDFVQKPVEQERILEAIARAVDRGRLGEGGSLLLGDIRARVSTLTDREREVAALIGAGLTNRQVGERIGITVRTAEGHRAAIIRKLGVREPQAIARFLKSLEEREG